MTGKGGTVYVCLKNEELTLEIASHGAEMRSLKDNQTGQEYLWDADPFPETDVPVLFPSGWKLPG